MIKVKVYAKVNISLLINGVENGFHMLDSVVASASIADVVSVQKSERDSVITSAKIESIENRIYSLISYMRALYSVPCLSVVVENNIPLGGGLGGSSADMAGVILAINELFSLNLSKQTLVDIANTTGSDTAFMLEGGCGKIINRCEVCDRFTMKPRPAIIATKGFCDTAKVFALFDASPQTLEYVDNSALICALKNGEDITGYNVNALAFAAKSINPAIEEGMEILGKGAGMSGSGSSVFAFCSDENKMKALESRGYKVLPCNIGDFRTEVIKE